MRAVSNQTPLCQFSAIGLRLLVAGFATSLEAHAYECGGAMQWKFECKVTKIAVSPVIADRYEGLQRIDLDHCFDNRGGHHADMAKITHVHADSEKNLSPMSWFDTVRFQGKETDNKIKWTGSQYRRGPKAVNIEGTLTTDESFNNSYYNETIYNRREVIGEINTKCHYVQPWSQ